MKKYITNLYGHAMSSTAMKAQNLVTKLAKQVGYSEIRIGCYSIGQETYSEQSKRIEGILSGVSTNSMVVVQAPTWHGINFDELLLQKLRDRAQKLVIFVHDFVPFMFVNNEYLLSKYIQAYNLADLVILPSEHMQVLLNENGLVAPVICQEIWDCECDIDKLDTPTFKRVLKFSGSVERFPFTKFWNESIPLEIFSNGFLNQGSTGILKGNISDSELLKELNKGGFGLVWSENIDNQNEREYSKMNTSFKFSTYLAAGIPIIVNKGLAKEEFVEKYKLGYVANDLKSAVEYVEKISKEEYDSLVKNVKPLSFLIKDGFFTKKLLIQVQEALFLKGREG